MSDARDLRLPLQGVTVADFSRVLAGPLCTMILADLGADVIKIERPVEGDDTRSWGPPFVEGGDAAYFLALNRNKRSIALDLEDPDDLAFALEIIAHSDIVVENFRPGVMASFGLDHESVSPGHEDLVYCSIPAFAGSPADAMPGYDLLMQAQTGYMSFTGDPSGQPVKMGVAILDVVAGLYAAIAVLAALRERDETGVGGAVKVGLYEASIAALVNQAANYLLGGVVPVAAGTAHPNIVPYQAFRGKEGQFVLAGGNDKLFRAACLAIGRQDLADDPRYATNAKRVANREPLIGELQAVFEGEPVAHWIELLQGAGVPAAPVMTIDQVFASPEANTMVSSVADPVRGMLRLVRSPIEDIGLDESQTRPPPRLGEHGDQIRSWIAGLRVEKRRARS
ncbi:MAG: CaiB/BaiF CoA transferase family protein [Acidimicrobiia bacterium]